MSAIRTYDLLATASAEAGLDDFGSDSFREGLGILVQALNDEAALNDLGRAALERQIVTNLVNRLRVTDWLATHPEVADETIERPLFILGMPRTGTTLLSYLLDQDPNLRSLMGWEALNSVPPPETATFHTDPRIEARAEGQKMMRTVNPGFDAIHYEAPDGPTECVTLFSQEFKSLLWETLTNVPTYSQWLMDNDCTSAYEYHRRMLQLLQSRAPGRWSLKSPAHCFALDALVARYPDARFIVTHRDPARVCASVCSLITSLSGTFTDTDHGNYIRRHWPWVIDEAVTRLMDFRDRRSDIDKSFYDMQYAELVADPVGEVRRAYDHFGEPLTPEAEAAMASYAATNPQGAHGTHRYTLGDLGLVRSELNERFTGYRERFDVPIEE